jgi:hypothetical protein
MHFMEFHMSATTITQAQGKGLRHHFADFSNAVRQFSSALYAAQGREFLAQEGAAKPAVSARAKRTSRLRLFALADEAQATSPSLSAELRNLASRG